MTSSSFTTSFDFERQSGVRRPSATWQIAPNALELDNAVFSGIQASIPLARLSSPLTQQVPATVVESLTSPPRNKYRFLNACCISVLLGLNDSALGALLPYIEKDYSITYTIVSLIFVAVAMGFIGATPFTSALQSKLGRGKMLVLTQALMLTGAAINSRRPPFIAVVAGNFLIGLGAAWAWALNNVFCASMANATTVLGIFHGSYGIGGVLGPLTVTLVTSRRAWSEFYIISLSLAAFNGIGAYWSCRGYEAEIPSHFLPHSSNQADRNKPSWSRALVKALHNRTTIVGALFIFAYQGAEVSISGWIISFLLTSRPHPPSQSASLGYVTSGFWGGIAQ